MHDGRVRTQQQRPTAESQRQPRTSSPEGPRLLRSGCGGPGGQRVMIGRGSGRVTSVTERSSPHRQSLPRCRGQTPIVPSPSSSTSTTVPLAARHGPPRVSRKCALPDHHVRHQVDVQPGKLRAMRTDCGWVPDRSQAKNVVFNVSEMEAKVRDATNDEPWCVLCIWCM